MFAKGTSVYGQFKDVTVITFFLRKCNSSPLG